MEDARKKMMMGGETMQRGKRGEAGAMYRDVLKPPTAQDLPPWCWPHFCITALQSSPTAVPSYPSWVSLHPPDPGEFPLSIPPFRAETGPLSGAYSKAEVVFWSPWQIH